MSDPLDPIPEETTGVRKYWFGDCGPDGWVPASPEVSLLLDRVTKQSQDNTWSRPSWNDAVTCGFCKNQDEYFSLLQDLCIAWVRDEIRTYSISDEARLIQLVLILRETDLMISRIAEQVAVWNSMTAYDPDPISSEQSESDPIRCRTGADNDGISLLSQDLLRMKSTRSRLSKDIAVRSDSLLPNCSALVGSLVAARLLAAAGGLRRLSRMPGSAIQILGARNAFFSHRYSGSLPPKHGLIFEHKRVHVAPRKVRGRVARTLAANLAMASRIDYYRGIADPEFLKRADFRIDRAGRRS